jgi:plasmid stabilization system protein ParE
MIRSVRFHPAARREYAAAIDRADREWPGRGNRFQAEVERAADRIVEAPEQGSPYLYGTRRYILVHFPYSTVYVSLEVGHIIAVAHHKRRPGYRRKRLRSIH